MSEIQQAIFTSARTDRMDGYQLAAASEGVSQELCDELSAWGPAHDSLLNPESRLGSFNFHRLKSGAYCLSKTVPSGSEYSGRNGPRIYTTFLILTPEQFGNFSNQPFRVLDAAIAAGYLRVIRRFNETLPTVRLRGRASAALSTILEPLVDEHARQQVLALGAAVCQGNVMVSSSSTVRMVLDRLFNLLPVGCRREVSFSTGLMPSTSRPLRLQRITQNDLGAQAAARQIEAAVLNLEALPSEPCSGWWALVNELLEREQFGEIVNLLSQTEDIELGDLANWNAGVTN